MAPRTMPWFRAYSRTITSKLMVRAARQANVEKVIALGVWAGLMNLASESPCRGRVLLTRDESLETDEIVEFIGVARETYERVLDAFLSLGMIVIEAGAIRFVGWDEEQYEGDRSTERVRKHRAGKGETPMERGCNGDETPMERGCNGDVTPMERGCNGDVTPMERGCNGDETPMERGCNGDETPMERGCNGIETAPDTEADTETETETEVPPSAGPAEPDRAGPKTFEDWKNAIFEAEGQPGGRPAVLVKMVEALYPGCDPPDHGFVGKAAKELGGAARLAQLLWEQSTRPPAGDPVRFCLERGKWERREGRGKGAKGPADARDYLEAAHRMGLNPKH